MRKRKKAKYWRKKQGRIPVVPGRKRTSDSVGSLLLFEELRSI